jgi:hypothetical protein
MERADGILSESRYFELIDPYFEDPYDLVAMSSLPYEPGKLSMIYKNSPPEKRKEINEETDTEFRRLTNFMGQLDPKNPDHKDLILKWFRMRDVLMELKYGEKGEHMHTIKIEGETIKIGPYLHNENWSKTIGPLGAPSSWKLNLQVSIEGTFNISGGKIRHATLPYESARSIPFDKALSSFKAQLTTAFMDFVIYNAIYLNGQSAIMLKIGNWQLKIFPFFSNAGEGPILGVPYLDEERPSNTSIYYIMNKSDEEIRFGDWILQPDYAGDYPSSKYPKLFLEIRFVPKPKTLGEQTTASNTLSREISDFKVYHEDPFVDASKIQGLYQANWQGILYSSLDPNCRKKIAQEVDKQFQRVTGFVGTLPSISQARNERERNLIRTWLRFRDIIVEKQLDVLCPDLKKTGGVIEPPAGGVIETPAGGYPPPPVNVHYDPYHEEVLHKIDLALTGAHAIGSLAEVLEWFHVLPEWSGTSIALYEGTSVTLIGGPIAGLITKLVIPLGYLALIAETVIQLYLAFTTGRRILKKKGFCYGLVCKAAGLKVPLIHFEPWAPDTGEELTNAFRDGTIDGVRAFNTDIILHNKLIMGLAYEKIINNRYHVTDPEERLLNRLWEQVRGDDLPGTHLQWAFDWGGDYLVKPIHLRDGKPPTAS